MQRFSTLVTVAFSVVAVIFAACSAVKSEDLTSTLPTGGLGIQMRPVKAPSVIGVNKYLFVSDLGSRIEILQHGTYKNIGQIVNGIDLVTGIWVDNIGDLYAANANRVTEYVPGGTSPACTYSSELTSPVDGTTDTAGNVYVADFNHLRAPGYVDKYAQCRDVVVQRYQIPLGPGGVAVDRRGDIFVSFVRSQGGSAFEEFQKGKTAPTLLKVTTGPGGGIVIDGKGNLISVDQANGLILVIPPPYTTATTLVSGLQNPFKLALNRAQTLLFCVNTYSETVTVYDYPSGKLVTTLGTGNGIRNPAGVAYTPGAVF